MVSQESHSLLPLKSSVYVALIVSMLCGRLIGQYVILFGISGTPFIWRMFTAGAFINAVPGIILQLVIIPFIVFSTERYQTKVHGVQRAS